MKYPYLLLIFILVCTKAYPQKTTSLPYKNANLPVNTRVNDLLGRMTADEKFRQLFMVTGDMGSDSASFLEGIFGFQTNVDAISVGASNQIMKYNFVQNDSLICNKLNAIQRFFIENTRLGIPVIFYDESLHGLIQAGCTSFPQSIALAATFDETLMETISIAIANECKARGIRQTLSPVVNIATDVRWGRTEETYGEDPFLSSVMGVAYVKSFEKLGIVCTPKHFVANVGEGGRDSYPIYFNERYLEESAFVPFKAVIKEGGARSIMTSYNSLNGRPCSANNWLLNTKLKEEWGFQGMVISDAGGTGGSNVLHFTAKDYEDAGKQAIENGLDVIFQTSFDSYSLFKKPFLNGVVRQNTIDSAVARVLKIKFELGLFDHPYLSELPLNIPYADHRKLAKKAALESAVLLKNDAKKILPISKEYKNILIVGADAKECRLGGYSGPGISCTSIYDGVKAKFEKQAKIEYAEGCARIENNFVAVEGKYLSSQKNNLNILTGLLAEYYNNCTLSGKPKLTRIDKNINFQWTLFSPDTAINYDFFSVRWTGFINCPESGIFKIGIEGNDGYKLYLNDLLLINRWNDQSFNTTTVDYKFEKGKEYKLRVEYKESAGNSKFKLVWNYGLSKPQKSKIQEAVSKASKSDVVIIVVGIEEGEFHDRSSLRLPGYQEELINSIAKTGKPIVIILVGGSAISMQNWIANANAIVDVWYPGEAGGEAIAELLAGDENFSGKLPITFPMSEGQLPLSYNHKPTGRGDDYLNESGQALFPFGYGLSYTQFDYSSPAISKARIRAGETSKIEFKIKNTGNYDGDEVVQLYIYDELASVVRPIKELKAFKRVHLKAGEEKSLSFDLRPSMFEMLDESMKKVIEPGFFRIMIGSSSKDCRIRERIEIY